MIRSNSLDAKLHLRWLAVLVFVAGVSTALFQIRRDPTPNYSHPAIRSTAWVSFALWAGAVGLIIPTRQEEWAATATRFRVAKWSWTLAAAMFLVHLGVAFHLGHRWSHADAYQHVEKSAGFGPGIFVSYFFTLLWLTDAVWWVTWPTSYAARPRGVGWAVHAFMAFITFNGTVVYVGGWMRWTAAAVFAVLAAAIVWRWVRVGLSPATLSR